MWAVLAIIAFAVALIFHLAGGSVARYVLDAELAGFTCLALHMAYPLAVPARRTPPR
jgi:hypothetical protein